MGLAIVALVLFLAMVVAWAVLPGSAMSVSIQESTEPLSVNAVTQVA